MLFVTATAKPVIAMQRRARNLKNMKRSLARVVSLVDMQLRAVTRARARSDIPLLIHMMLMLVLGSGSAEVDAGEKARTMYSPKIMAMMAAEPGFKTKTEDQVKRKPKRSPKILER